MLHLKKLGGDASSPPFNPDVLGLGLLLIAITRDFGPSDPGNRLSTNNVEFGVALCLLLVQPLQAPVVTPLARRRRTLARAVHTAPVGLVIAPVGARNEHM